MGYALLKEKVLIGANFSAPPKSARERAVDRWFIRKKPLLSTTTTSDKTVPGQYFDAESNLHYNWNRYYDPSLWRYITSDPIGLGGGLNSYTYANSDPVGFIDPQGLAAGAIGRALYCLANPECVIYAVTTCYVIIQMNNSFTQILTGKCNNCPDAANDDEPWTPPLTDNPSEPYVDPTLPLTDPMMNENKDTKKKIKGLQDHVDKHKDKITDNPDSRDVPHWETEIKAAEDRIKRLKKRLPKRQR